MSYRMVTDQQFWEEFIYMYKSFPCLWDSKSKEYTIKRLRDAALAELVNKCLERYPNADRNFVTKKIHSFRCAFRREHKKVLNSMANGASPDDMYVSQLWYYEIISFILDKSVSGEDNIMTEDVIKSEVMYDSDNDQALSSIEAMMESPLALDSPGSSRPESPQSPSSAKRPRCPQTTFKKRPLRDYAAEVSKKNRYFEVTGMKYASDLATLHPVQCNYVEKIVSEAMFYAKQGKLTDYSSLQLVVNPPCGGSNQSQQHQYQPSTTS